MDARKALTAFWEERTGRERAILAGAAAFALAAALYGLLWEPGLKASARLEAALPRLRAQVEDMRLGQREVQRLRKTSGTASTAADLRALLRAAIARSALAGSAHALEWQPNERVAFSAASADFDAWLQWVAGVQRDLGVRLESCQIAALGEPGRVRIEARFVAAGGAPRVP